jgi:diguanylate cyclase (GGDEF)-like protein
VRSFPAELDSLLAVAAALLDEEGSLLEANAGFLRLLSAPGNAIGANVAGLFVQPDFVALVAAARGDAEGYRGLMNLGERGGEIRTLRGRAHWGDTGIRVLAEYDVEGLELLAKAMVGLNEESSVARQALVRSNVALRQREVLVVEAAFTDALTGVGNRRKLDQALVIEASRVAREGGALSAIMADLDHFKRVNDDHGHATGDRVLAAFGALLRSMTRKTDVVARYGGEEFTVLLPHTRLEHAAAKAEGLRKALAALRFDPPGLAVTSSFGAAELMPGEAGDAMLARADRALYEAKAAGRDRVVCAYAPLPPPAMGRAT